MGIGDTVYCIEDVKYFQKDEEKVVKAGYSFIIKGIVGDCFVLDRFGKPFIICKKKVRLKN